MEGTCKVILCRVNAPLQYSIQDNKIKTKLKKNQDNWKFKWAFINPFVFLIILMAIEQSCHHLPIFDLPSMLTFTSWGIKEGLGSVKGGSSSVFSTFRPSGADHLRFLPLDCLLDPTTALLATRLLETDSRPPNTRSPFFSLVPLPQWARWLMPFSRSLCLEPPPPQLWGVSDTTLLGFRCPWLDAGAEAEVASSSSWVFFRDPFLRFLRVSEIQTSPTESLVQGSSRSWVVRSGQHEDHPWPKTKKGYSTKTSTLTWMGRKRWKDWWTQIYLCANTLTLMHS